RTGTRQLALAGHRGEVSTVAYSPDGAKILTSSEDGDARVFDARTGRLLLLLPGLSWRASTLYGARYSRDGERIVTASTDHTARVWDAATGAVLRVLSGHNSILWDAAFSPDGTRVVTGAADATARIWAMAGAAPSMILRSADHVNDAEYSPDGSRIVTASDNGSAGIWDAGNGREVARLVGHTAAVNSAVYSPDGMHILTASSDKTARIWDARTQTQVSTLTTSDKEIYHAGYSKDGTRIVSSHFGPPLDIWDAGSGSKLLEITGDDLAYVTASQFSPSGERIVTASLDRMVRIWNARTGAQERVFAKHGDFVNAAHFSPDGLRIVSGGADRAARVWDPGTGAELALLTGHRGRINDANFSPDGRFIATASADKTLRIWDASTGVQLAVLEGHEQSVDNVAYAPDGAHVVTASLDDTARVWEAKPPAALTGQIDWADAAEPDPLNELQRMQLGIQPVKMPDDRWSHASECDRVAGAYYDPVRRAAGVVAQDINADIAKAACEAPGASMSRDARGNYEIGRARLAKADFTGAREYLERSVAVGYAAAKVDLADLLIANGSSAIDAQRAVSLYQQAWGAGVHLAAHRLGSLFEHGVKDSGKVGALVIPRDEHLAWAWYQQGAATGEPTSLGRFGERSDAAAEAAPTAPGRNAHMLRAFQYYALAAARAKNDDWPDEAWYLWRYRRATLARYLAREGLMQTVADAYNNARQGRLPISSPIHP
ncbi:MAG: hypothetical protein KGL25_03290, partial [Gammaproteobacteria bacterium]|nr:hypothetical protein [Gammaproteobacteria bacterium]